MYILRSLLVFVTVFLWFCADMQEPERWDVTAMPSLLGPGSYLAWMVTGIDSFWDSGIASLFRERHFRTLLNFRIDEEYGTHQRVHMRTSQFQDGASHKRALEDRRPTPVLQLLTFVAYAVVSSCYLLDILIAQGLTPDTIAHADALFLITSTVLFFLLPLNPFLVRVMALAAYVVVSIGLLWVIWHPKKLTSHSALHADAIFLETATILLSGVLMGIYLLDLLLVAVFAYKLSNFPAVGCGIIQTYFFIGILGFTILTNPWLRLWGMRTERLPGNRNVPKIDPKVITSVLYVTATLIAYILSYTRLEAARHCARLRLRAPWPETSYKLSEIDQVFAFGLALASLLYSRRRELLRICKKTGLQTRIALRRTRRLLPKRKTV
ncbi:hypothetical protein EJ04DRAFT_510483 [Polyplosphaeria fusca]|uniref:Uncharacterized protein n=1 Tax=Polyplosphaeria fusca TaxID=682080 RepID=A0A9P4R5D0_9PLEO|nr:hypothetical protein EJ04DRAFT_510483 [Polyplosphaeria fusca]